MSRRLNTFTYLDANGNARQLANRRPVMAWNRDTIAAASTDTLEALRANDASVYWANERVGGLVDDELERRDYDASDPSA